MTPWLHVIGIGEDGLSGLSASARALIATAEVLVGGERHLGFIGQHEAERLTWERPLEHTVEAILARRTKRVVVLASGDPLSYGIGTLLVRHIPLEELRVLPIAGAASLAAARLGWPSASYDVVTLHGRPLEMLLSHLAPNARLLILSRDGATPSEVAERLAKEGYGASRMIVFEHLGGPKEHRLEGLAADWPHGRVADLNTVALEARADGRARRFAGPPGLPDKAFAHDGQLTKREVRAVTLALLYPHPGALLWDVGAGAGSVAIEWLLQAPRAEAIAIERASARVALIARNAEALGVPRLQIEQGEAPAVLDGLPDPDAIFIGGGLSAPGLIETCWTRLKPGGRLVANAITLDGEAALLAAHERYGGTLGRLAISRAEPLGEHLGWRALAPITQFAALKPP